MNICSRYSQYSLFHLLKYNQVRILLNHFKWDKERLMERLYSDDQEAMFVEAQVWKESRNLTQTKEPCPVLGLKRG